MTSQEASMILYIWCDGFVYEGAPVMPSVIPDVGSLFIVVGINRWSPTTLTGADSSSMGMPKMTSLVICVYKYFWM